MVGIANMATIVGSFDEAHEINNQRENVIVQDNDEHHPRDTSDQFSPNLSNQAFISENVVMGDILDSMKTDK